MKLSKALKSFEIIAAQEGVSVAEVREQIRLAIEQAMNDPDPEVKKRWESIKFRNEVPTPEEFVVYMAKEVKRRSMSEFL